ncbi:hypothetical protein SRHO_G00208630 [Serrasalmus rhombeus]
MESTGKSRTLQSGLALLYGFLPDFPWSKLTVRQQWSTLFCGSSCDCPARSRYLDLEQKRQYRQRTSDAELEHNYVAMATALGGACLTLNHFAVIRRQQHDDERERQEVGLYRRYAVLAAHPYLNRTALRMEAAVRRRRKGIEEPVFALASAHDVTMAPLLSALGLEGAGFPRFAAQAGV